MAIKQTGISYIKSRKDCKVTHYNGGLPLITAPMSCVANTDNYKIFTDLGISVCLPRTVNEVTTTDTLWNSYSLLDFSMKYCNPGEKLSNKTFVCIDTANGNMEQLHSSIKFAKSIHNDDLIIMSGNVASAEAFVALAKTGCDYIRVGIGGSSVCSTYLNTGVGNDSPLNDLILGCYRSKVANHLHAGIVADGISSYVEYLVVNKQGLPNGYAAINRLLYAGADYVMIGTLFAQAFESAAEKYINYDNFDELTVEEWWDKYHSGISCVISGMSTQVEQSEYKHTNWLRHSEGFTKDFPVKYSLKDWLHGSKDQDTSGLSGFIPNLQSAMSYAGVDRLHGFVGKF